MRVGVLTGGGDCPGLNAVIRAIVRKGEMHHGDEIIGFLDAWDGILERRMMPLDVRSLRGMLPKGGTLLGTKRGSPFDHPDGPERVRDAFEELGLDGLIVIGGNGSLTVSCRLHDMLDLPIVGVPKTIDNDIVGTDVTFGFHTAVQIATDAIDRLHTTAEAHDRVMVVEVMGRHAGWIATYAGIAGGATVILVPELPFDIDEVSAILRRRHERGRFASIVVVAEGAVPKAGTPEAAQLAAAEYEVDQFGHLKLGGIAHLIAPAVAQRTGFDTRVVSLGHVQRGGTPNAYDRVLCTRYGLAAIDAVHDKAWGEMVVYREMRIERAPMRMTLGRTRSLDLAMYRDVASVFFG
jgi:ATP-dependent phosphofructokinase / diphosphate-dependent phosphofructokinase